MGSVVPLPERIMRISLAKTHTTPQRLHLAFESDFMGGTHNSGLKTELLWLPVRPEHAGSDARDHAPRHRPL